MADQDAFARVVERLGPDAGLRMAMLSLERSSDSIFWFDSNLRVVHANEAACRSLGYAIDELLGLLVTDIDPAYPADATNRMDVMAANADDGGAPAPTRLGAMADGIASRTYETVHRRKDGRLLAVEVSAAPIDVGEQRYFVAAARDASSRRWMEPAIGDVAARPATGNSPGTAKAAPPHAAATPDAGPAVSASPFDTPPRSTIQAAARTRVLVVEDNRLNQRVARQMLEHLGVVVETAGDGREAVEAMRRGPARFDAILMDMQMPEMDGLEATRAIRAEFPTHAVPIIAATASVDLSDMTVCLDAGMNDYVSKPIEPRQLARVLSRWVTLPSAPPPLAVAAGPTPMKGVDVTAALVRLNGQHGLLVRLLRVFAQEHGRTTADIASAIAGRDFDGALRLVHNLKGVAGTLSATDVFEAARALESSLRDGSHASLPAMLDRLGTALDVVCGSVSEWTGGVMPAKTDKARHDPDRPVVAALLAELDTLLKNRRFSARQRFEQLKKQLNLPELTPTMDHVQRCLDRLEFHEAREILPSIASALGVPFSRA